MLVTIGFSFALLASADVPGSRDPRVARSGQRVIVEVVECRAMYSCIDVECCRGCIDVEALQPPCREAT